MASVKISHVRTVRDGHLSFVIEGVDVALVNAIRRTILSEIPNVAFNAYDGSVVIHTNTCSLHNELLAHRMSMVPVCLAEDEIEHFDKDRYKFVIKMKNTTGEMMSVTTEHLQVLEGGVPRPDVAKRLFPRNEITKEHILITKLKPNHVDRNNGDELNLEATATFGVAKTHACFSPVSLCTFSNTVDDGAAAEALEVFKKRHADAGGSSSDEVLVHQFNALHRERCFVKNEKGEPRSFAFNIESECRMSPTYIFLKAIDVLVSNVRSLAKKLDGVNEEVHGGLSIFHVEGFDHTIGNLVQALVYNMHHGGHASSTSTPRWISYIGYFMPHPLESSIVFKLKTDHDAKLTFQASLADIAEEFVRFKEAVSSQLGRQ